MLSIQLVVVLIAVVGNGFLSLFTLFKNPKSATNRLFFLFTVSLTIYLAVNYLVSLQTKEELAFFWIKTVMSLALFINLLFFLLADVFPQQKMLIRPVIFWPLLIITVILSLFAQTDFVFKRVILKPSGIETILGIGMPFFLLHTVLFLGWGFVALIRKLKNVQNNEKTQIKLFLLGVVFMFVAILTTNVLFVLLFDISAFVSLLPLYTLIFVGFIGYAIVRHRFLDIRLVVARAVAYTIILIVIGIYYALFFFLIGSKLFAIPFSTTQLFIYGVIGLFIAFTFQSLRRMIEKVTDAIFYRGHYDKQELLEVLSSIMSTTIELDKLTLDILKNVLSNMRISRGVFVLLEQKGHEGNIEYIEYRGYEHAPHFRKEDIQQLISENKMILFDEIEEGLVKSLMRNLNISAVLPLVVREVKVGVLFLGEKASGEIYSQKDIDVFGILAPQLSVAIQNSLEYEEIKRFNITLRDEVERATSALKYANDKLKQLDKMKDEFVSLASHELRTPMTAIKSYLWMVLEKKDNQKEKQEYYLQHAYESTDRLIKLVNDMLNVSRIESGRITLELKAVDMHKLTQDVIEELSPRARELEVKFSMLSSSSIPKVLADADKIKEVLINLIGNSLKFTPKQGMISVSYKVVDEMVETRISDTGKGIFREDLPKLFQKFGIVGNTYLNNQSTPGTGLGLYISKSIVELHGGNMWVKSDGKDKGTTFGFTIKIYKNI